MPDFEGCFIEDPTWGAILQATKHPLRRTVGTDWELLDDVKETGSVQSILDVLESEEELSVCCCDFVRFDGIEYPQSTAIYVGKRTPIRRQLTLELFCPALGFPRCDLAPTSHQSPI